MGAVHIARERGTVFIEVFADSDDAVRDTIRTLPMSPWFELDLFAVRGPPTSSPT